MADAADAHFFGAEESRTEEPGAASAAPASPLAAPSDASSSAGSSSNVFDKQSPLLLKIKELAETQRALKEQRKKCAAEIKNAMKRKKRLQTKANQLGDNDLVEVLRMHADIGADPRTRSMRAWHVEMHPRRRCGDLTSSERPH